MSKFWSRQQQSQSQRGQGATEYAIIIALVGVATVVIVMLLGPAIRDVFSDIVAQAPVAPPNLVGFTRVAPTPTPTPVPHPTLTLLDDGHGVAQAQPPGPYNANDQVNLVAVPNSGYVFDHWSGDLTGTTEPIQIELTQNLTITAHFRVETFTLNVTTTGNGSVTKIPDRAEYDTGTAVVLQAIPDSGWNFVEWTGDASGTNASINIVMDSDKNIVANFGNGGCYPLTTDASPGGTGSVTVDPAPNCDAGTGYTHGLNVTLTASPQAGYEFDQWTGDASGATISTTLLIDGPKTVTARFVPETFTLTTLTSGTGSVTVSPNQASYAPGTVVQLTAVPGAGWTFSGWLGNGVSGSSNPINVTMTEDKTVTAYFDVTCYTLTTAVSPANTGTVTASPVPNCSGFRYTQGTEVVLTATPGGGYLFDQWTGDATGTNLTVRVTMDGNRSVTANFVDNPTVCYSLNVGVSPGSSGSVNQSPQPNCGGNMYVENTQVTLTANPSTGYTFGQWTGSVTGTNNPVVVNMNANKSVTANFTVLCYTVSTGVAPLGSGSITTSPTPNCGGGRYQYGTNVSFTAVPAGGYQFANWSGALSGSANPASLTVSSNAAVSANFTTNGNVLFVVGNPNGLTANETSIRTRLQAAFYAVTLVDDDVASAADAAGKSLVLISASGGGAGSTMRDVSVPVMVMDRRLFDDMEFTGNNSHGNDNNETQVTVTGGHPLAAGLSGNVTIVSSNNLNLGYGNPVAGAVNVAATISNSSRQVIFGFNQGATLDHGQPAAARRVGFGLFEDGAAASRLNANGWSLFDAAVNWAITGN